MSACCMLCKGRGDIERLCNSLTEQECFDRNLFGDKAKRLDCLDEIEPGEFGFFETPGTF